ncbi:MAG: hypothetical protein VX737_02205 [Pseudomonadota bacterium]|nr:hypothetical protein [Pseudomonadota bacterium]
MDGLSLRLYKFFLLVIIFSVSGCSCFHVPKFLQGSVSECDEEKNETPPYKEYVYLDKKVYVYQKDYLFDLLEPQMHRQFETLMRPVVVYAKENPGFKIAIRSYGDDAKNSTFSSKQIDFEAEVVAAYLWAQGLSNDVSFHGYGKGRHPVSSNRDATVGRENRRVEIEFVDGNQKS